MNNQIIVLTVTDNAKVNTPALQEYLSKHRYAEISGGGAFWIQTDMVPQDFIKNLSEKAGQGFAVAQVIPGSIYTAGLETQHQAFFDQFRSVRAA